MIDADPEYYQTLKKELTTHARWFSFSMLGFFACLGCAYEGGPTNGWPWLLGALAALLFALWAKIDQQHTRVLIQIYLANAK